MGGIGITDASMGDTDTYHDRGSTEYLKKELTAEPKRKGQGTLEFVPTGVPTLDEFKKKRHNEQEHGMYLELRLEEIKGHLDGNSLNKAKLDELVKKLDFELQEIERKLQAEIEQNAAMHEGKN